MRRARALLSPLSVPAFRRIWLAQIAGEVGEWSARLALAALVLERTGSPALMSLILAASLVPWLGPGQVLATLGDRYGRRNVMITADVVRALTFALMLVPAPVWTLFVLAFLAGLCAPPFSSARSAVTPELVPEEKFGAATALGLMTQDVAVITGYVVGGVLVGLVGAQLALVLNVLAFALSALLLLGLPRLEGTHAGVRNGLRQGLDALWKDKVVRRAVIVATSATSTMASMSTLAIVYGDRVLEGKAWLAGPALAGAALVSLVGTALVPHDRKDQLMRWSAGLCVLGGTGAGTLFLLLGSGAPGLLAFSAAGVLMIVIVPANILVAPRLPREARAAAFSLLMGVMVIGDILGTTLAGALSQAVGVQVAAVLLLSIPVLVGAFALLRPVREAAPEARAEGTGEEGTGAPAAPTLPVGVERA